MFKLSYGDMGVGEGGFIASDLTGYGADHSAKAIEQAIVQPDTPLDPASRVVEVKTKTGQKLIGVCVPRTTSTWRCNRGRPLPLSDASSLAEVKYNNYSLMPHDYGTRLTSKELYDLASFLIVTSKDARWRPPPRRKAARR